MSGRRGWLYSPPMNEAAAPGSDQDATDDAFGRQLLALRLAARLTQEELAERSGLSARTISDLERGRRPAPHPVSAHMLAIALGLDDARRARFFASMRQHRRLRAEARAAAAAAPPPADEAAILGRDADLAAIEGRFAAGDRLLTLAGPGGVGKSRLARAVAVRREQAGLPVLRVSLDAISSPDLVLPAVARAAGAPAHGPGSAADRIAAALGGDPTLLVLDNFEHLLDAAASVAALLAAAPALAMLVTSREALRIAGERVVSVPPLPLPAPGSAGEALVANPAVALFSRVLADAAP
ncbi:MAG: helix-turn-helix domain-containing protein [Chloroflexota bacterium]